MGRYVERFNRTYKFAAILGGSEDVLYVYYIIVDQVLLRETNNIVIEQG